MPYVVGKHATIRNGEFIRGGTKFEAPLEELPSLEEAGFEILSDSPKLGNINTTPENVSKGKTENFPEEIQGSVVDSSIGGAKVLSNGASKATKPMGGSSTKAKTTTKVKTSKEG